MIMDNNFQNTLNQSLQNWHKWLEFTKTARYKRLHYLTKDGWGNGVGAMSLFIAWGLIAVSVIWISWGWAILAAVGLTVCTAVTETLLQNAMQKHFIANNIEYHTKSLAVATASYKLKVLEECKKAQATAEQMEDLQKLALTDDAPQGWWEFVFKQAKASVEKEKQYHLWVKKSQEEQQALVQIQQIMNPVVPVEQQTENPIKHKTLQL